MLPLVRTIDFCLFQIFNGNLDGSKVKENHLFPPILGRYIRLQPVTIQRNPALRMELLGCDLNSESLCQLGTPL